MNAFVSVLIELQHEELDAMTDNRPDELATAEQMAAAIINLPPARQRAAVSLIHLFAIWPSEDVETVAGMINDELTARETYALALYRDLIGPLPEDDPISPEALAKLRALVDAMHDQAVALRSDLRAFDERIAALESLADQAIALLSAD
jgi:hypothetical protein